MDWQSVRFDWNRARAFLVTAEEGSLSAAARALGMAQPTLGRQVAALEEELGVALFDRVGRGVTLSPAGLQLLDHVRAMGDAARAMSLGASGQSRTIEGHVTITASELYAEWLLPPILRTLRDVAPGLTVGVVASNAIRDLRRREADIAIRNARPDDPDLIARQIAEDRGGLFATPDCLARCGPVAQAADLAGAPFVGFEDLGPFLSALQARGIPVSADTVVVRASSHSVHWAMTRAGLGIGVGPFGLGRADGALVPVLPDAVSFGFPVWLAAHRELRMSARLRLVWDLLAARLPEALRTAHLGAQDAGGSAG